MDFAKLKMLIVDDEKTLVWAMRECFEEQGMDVVTANCGKQAIEQIEQNDFDVVISDLKMPDSTGIDVARSAMAKNPDTVFIILTAYGSFETAVEGIKLGISDYLSKPFKINSLTQAVNSALEKRKIYFASGAAPATQEGNIAFMTKFAPDGPSQIWADIAEGDEQGNFFSIVKTDESKYALFFGRIENTTTQPASNIAALANGYLSCALENTDRGLSHILADFREFMASYADEGSKLHIFCTQIDLEKEQMHYCNCGCVWPLFYNFRTKSLAPLPPEPAIEIDEAAKINLFTMNIQSGDQIVLSAHEPGFEQETERTRMLESIEHLIKLKNVKIARPTQHLIVENDGAKTAVVCMCANRVLGADSTMRIELQAQDKDVIFEVKTIVEMLCRQTGLESSKQHSLVTSALEILMNSMAHGYDEDKGKIGLEFSRKGKNLTVSIQDFGKGFDLRSYKEPNVDSIEGILDPNTKRGLYIAQHCVDKLEIASSPKTGTVVKLSQIVERG